MNKNKVDIIIPTYRPDKNFNELLVRLEKQTYPVNKIIIMNTEEQFWDESSLIEQNNREVIHLKKTEFDHGRVRDQGAGISDSEFLLFMTQDAMPKDKYLVENLVKQFDDYNVGAAYARQLPRNNCKVIESYTRSFNYPEISRIKSLEDLDELGIKTFFCSNVCAMYRKEDYIKLGGFVKRTIFNEDMIYAGKLIYAGKKIAYVADAQVIHSHNYNYIEYFKRNFDLAVSQKDHPEIFDNVKSESEGIKMIKQTMKYLVKHKKIYLIPDLIIQSGFKWLGYRFGKSYNKLPQKIILNFTLNKEYWKV